MPRGRKYSGPLVPGTTSTRQFNRRVPRRVKGKRVRYFAKTAKKAPLSNKQRSQVRQIIKGRKEIKFGTFFEYDNLGTTAAPNYNQVITPRVFPFINAPVADAAGFTILQTGYNLNAVSTAMNSSVAGSVNPIGGYHMLKGDTSTTRDGDFMRLQSHRVNLRINMLKNAKSTLQVENQYPLKFQVYLVRPKQLPSGYAASLSAGIFIGPQNQIVGIADIDASVFQLSNLFKINKDQWHLDKLKTFILQNPSSPGATDAEATTYVGPRYPTSRSCSFWLHKPKKDLRFTNTTSATGLSNEPENLNLTSYIIVVATRIGDNGDNDTTNSYADRWTLATNGVSKFVDM